VLHSPVGLGDCYVTHKWEQDSLNHGRDKEKVITTNIRVNRPARRLEGNKGKWDGGGNVAAGGRRGGERPMALLSVALV
jgi:hypothetical protein